MDDIDYQLYGLGFQIHPVSNNGSDLITIRPKWWQFWKKPRTISVAQAMRERIEETQAKMLNNLSINVYTKEGKNER